MPRRRSCIGCLPFLANPLQEDGSGLIVRVLRDELPLEGALEDGLAEAGGALEITRDDSFRFRDYREPSVGRE